MQEHPGRSIVRHIRRCLGRIEGKHYAHLFVCGGNNDNFALIAPPFCVRDFFARWNWLRSPLSLACRAHWATKLFPNARCRRGAQCTRAVLLFTPQPLSDRDTPPLRILWVVPILRPLLWVRILRSLLWFLSAMGLVRHRTSLGLVTGAEMQMCEGALMWCQTANGAVFIAYAFRRVLNGRHVTYGDHLP
jgi:hypothetical protein